MAQPPDVMIVRAADGWLPINIADRERIVTRRRCWLNPPDDHGDCFDCALLRRSHARHTLRGDARGRGRFPRLLPGKITMSPYGDLLAALYDAFNDRDIDRALTAMHAEVEWPNGMAGDYVHGHDEVRSYWSRQWRLIDPHVEPRRFRTDTNGQVVVDVRQVIRNRDGAVIGDEMVQHVFLIDGGLIKRMEIRKFPR